MTKAGGWIGRWRWVKRHISASPPVTHLPQRGIFQNLSTDKPVSNAEIHQRPKQHLHFIRSIVHLVMKSLDLCCGDTVGKTSWLRKFFCFGLQPFEVTWYFKGLCIFLLLVWFCGISLNFAVAFVLCKCVKPLRSHSTTYKLSPTVCSLVWNSQISKLLRFIAHLPLNHVSMRCLQFFL